MLLGSLGATLLGNLSTGKSITKLREGTTRPGQEF